MKNKNHTLKLCNYCNRVYDLNQKISQISDGRVDPEIKLPPVILIVILSLMSGLHSFSAMGEAVKDGDFDKFFSNTKLPSDDTIKDVLRKLNLEDLREIAASIVQKARYNQALKSNTIEGMKVVAIDGTHIFSMSSERLGENAQKREYKDEEGNITAVEYEENAVGASYVGEGISLPLKLKRRPQGEGELTTAKKLVDDLNRDHYQYCDVIVGDSLYINGPFINRVLSNNKEVIVRVKQENNLKENAEGLFKGKAPDHTYENVTPKDKRIVSGILYDLEIWEEENFIWSSVEKPLRVLKVKETKKKVNASGEVLEKETQICYFATTMEKSRVDAFTVWKIAHRRWDEENGIFHWLKTNWDLDRRYSHEPEIIQAMYYLYVIAYSLFLLYIHRNLRSFDPKKETKKKFIRRFYKGLITLNQPLYYPGITPG